jgi:hypothetical protein
VNDQEYIGHSTNCNEDQTAADFNEETASSVPDTKRPDLLSGPVFDHLSGIIHPGDIAFMRCFDPAVFIASDIAIPAAVNLEAAARAGSPDGAAVPAFYIAVTVAADDAIVPGFYLNAGPAGDTAVVAAYDPAAVSVLAGKDEIAVVLGKNLYVTVVDDFDPAVVVAVDGYIAAVADGDITVVPGIELHGVTVAQRQCNVVLYFQGAWFQIIVFYRSFIHPVYDSHSFLNIHIVKHSPSAVFLLSTISWV